MLCHNKRILIQSAFSSLIETTRRWDCYVYWSQVDICWYKCDGVMYTPLDNCCNPNDNCGDED